ncbi:MAG TPA: class I SAM-dependent methyltransferase, partial [Clostridia bacterium]|nr:class I SAM-dependent methyltransferase [Clostridia bacterium]
MDQEGFDLWAAHYEESVLESDRKDEYPFAGYQALLSRVVDLIHQQGGRRILDLGLGTGLMAKYLYDQGYQITG